MEAIAEKYKNMIWPKQTPPSIPTKSASPGEPPLMKKNRDLPPDVTSRSVSSYTLDPVVDTSTNSKLVTKSSRRPRTAPETQATPTTQTTQKTTQTAMKNTNSSRSGSATRSNANDILAITKSETVSSIGKREYMEDVILCPKDLINGRFQAAFVFDGHSGGHASNYLHTNLMKLLPQFFTFGIPSTAIPNTITTILSKLGTEFKKRKKTDGSTISGVLVDIIENTIYIVNIGDSVTMVYGIQGKIIFISKRDSTDNAAERQRLAALGIEVEKDANSMWRMYGLNMSKAFGDYHTGPLEDALNKSGRKVHVETLPMPKGLQNLNIIIASDGLFDEIQPEHLAQVPIIRKLKLDELMRFVLDHGFKGDNFSAIRLQVSRQRK